MKSTIRSFSRFATLAVLTFGSAACHDDTKGDADGNGSKPVPVLDPNAPAAGALTSAPPAPIVAPDSNAPELQIVSTLPQGLVEGPVHPVVTFSQPVVALGTVAETSAPPFEISPPIKGSWRWLGSSSAEFVPEQRVPLSTTFTVRVPSGLLALSGGLLKTEGRYTFNTPPIQAQYGDPLGPYSNYAWARPDQKVSVTFSQRPTDKSIARDVV